MTPEYAAKLRQEMLDRLAARKSLLTWCERALEPVGQAPARHHRLIIDHLEKVTAGEIDRLIISAPPGSAKSTYTSVLFPAWLLANNPNSTVIALSYASDLAERFSSKVRATIDENGTFLGYKIKDDSRSKERWETTNGCEYRCAGLTGGITGFRADCVIIDDPIRNFSDAFSPVVKAAIWEEFTNSVMTRLKPNGKVVVIMTRWSPDDLAGRLIEEQPGEWTVLRLPAIAEDVDDPLGRALGEPLWPEYQTSEFLERLRRNRSDLEWSGLYQQRPRNLEGNLFSPAAIVTHKVRPEGKTVLHTVRAWDLAGTAAAEGKKPDWSVGLKLSKLSDGTYLIEDVVRFRGDPAMVEDMVRQTAIRDGRDIKICLGIDPGSAGKAANMYLARALAGYRIESTPESGSKITRAMPAVAQINAGNFAMLDAPWCSVLVEELATFPGGKHDDIVDALSRAFNTLTSAPRPARVIPWAGFSR